MAQRLANALSASGTQHSGIGFHAIRAFGGLDITKLCRSNDMSFVLKRLQRHRSIMV